MTTVPVGVDIDTWKVTLCALHPAGPAWQTAPLRRAGQSLLDAIRQTAFALPLACNRLDLRDDRIRVEFHVERGRGQHRKADFDLGAIYGAVIVALARACPNSHIASMDIPEWKRAVTAAVGLTTKRGAPGLGNVSKDVANDACRRLLADVYPLYAELGPDALDAFGVAYAAENRAAA